MTARRGHNAVADVSSPPAAWYFLAPARAVTRRQVVTLELAGAPVVAFRDNENAPAVLAAHCPHLGAHLGRGDVVGGQIRCALHHRRFDPSGHCVGSDLPGARAFPSIEWSGAIFAYLGPTPSCAFPVLGADHFRMGRAVEVDCSWRGVVANAFDLEHLSVVHRRALREPELVDRPGAARFRLRYRSRVVGSTIADRVVRRVSGDDVRVSIECLGGPTLRVVSTAGRHRSNLLLTLAPRGERTLVVPFFAASDSSGLVGAVRQWVAAWLYASFLRRDVGVLSGMRFAPRLSLPRDRVLAEFLAFLDSLPRPSPLERFEELG